MCVSEFVSTLTRMVEARESNPSQVRRAAALRRDRALSRVSGITAGIGIASVAGLGMIGFYVAKAFPGHQYAHPTTPSAGTSSTNVAGGVEQNTGATGNTGVGGQGITPPPTAPQSTPVAPPVTSGAS